MRFQVHVFKNLQNTFLLKTFCLDTESYHRPQSLRKQNKQISSCHTSTESLQNHDQLLTKKYTLKTNSWCFTQKNCLSTDFGNENYHDKVMMYISRNLTKSLTTFTKEVCPENLVRQNYFNHLPVLNHKHELIQLFNYQHN